jgi:hypothetical protein
VGDIDRKSHTKRMHRLRRPKQHRAVNSVTTEKSSPASASRFRNLNGGEHATIED